MGLFQPCQLHGTAQAAGVDEHGLVRDAAGHCRGRAAGVQKQGAVRPQQRQRFFSNDLLCLSVAGRAAAEQGICTYHLLHRLGSTVYPHHPARFIQRLEVGTEGHLRDGRERLLELRKADAAFAVDQFYDLIAALFHGGFLLFWSGLSHGVLRFSLPG